MSPPLRRTRGSPLDTTAVPPDEPDPQFFRVPLVRLQEDSQGNLKLVGTGPAEWVEGTAVRQQYGVDPALLRDFNITGDSMSGTLEPGDRIRAALSDCSPPSDRIICILRGPGSFLIRRVRSDGTGVVLVADNPDVPDLRIGREEWKQRYEQVARVLEIRRSV